MSFADSDLHEEILAAFAEAQRRFGTSFVGEYEQRLRSTWTARAISRGLRYHHELDELRSRRPVYTITLDARFAALPKNLGGRPWSPHEEAYAVTCRRKNIPDHEIGRRLDRTTVAVRERLSVIARRS